MILAKMLQAPPSHPRITHSSISNAKTHANTRTTPPVQANRAKKFTTFILNEQEKQINESLETFAKKKKASFMSILAEYIINAKIMLGIQVIHHNSKVIIEDL